MSVNIRIGDCRDVLTTLPAESAHMVCTSPPYWGLRDYGVTAQIGLEPDFNDYIATMVGVFREVKRVLRKDGTLWLNLGDSYAGGGTIGRNDQGKRISDGEMRDGWKQTQNMGSRKPATGLKPKDLCGIPWRLAFALQADGWYLRQDIIWSKPNPMPESVTDRCTKSHEYLFLLSKNARYYYDAEAIAEQSVIGSGAIRNITPRDKGAASTRNDGDRFGVINDGTRNKRSVWTVATEPYSEAHFATFPPALIEPCIKAGTSERGCCAQCGAPWVRRVQRDRPIQQTKRQEHLTHVQRMGHPDWQGNGTSTTFGLAANEMPPTITLGWSPSCACDAPAVPCTILDPFGGAGTTGLVADRLQRNAILIELNPEYAAMARWRIANDAPLFTAAIAAVTEIAAP